MVFDQRSPRLHADATALLRVFDEHAIVAAVREALIDHARGRFVQPAPLHLEFPGGDCHVKAGYLRGGETFVVKMATGFYANHRIDLPNAHGMLLLNSQRTGLPIVVFEDRGLLTAWRTTAAAVAAVQAGSRAGPLSVGVVGAGLQAEQIAGWLPRFCDVRSTAMWARDPIRAAQAATRAGPAVTVQPDLAALCADADVIVTTTPAIEPLIRAEWIGPGTHVVALGADNPGKVEIDPALFARAAAIMTDDHAQCLDHGDFGHAVRAGHVAADADVALGLVLAGDVPARRRRDDITIADLTGLAAQDDAIARLFARRLTMAAPDDR